MLYDSLHTIPIKVYHRVIETEDYSLLEYESLSESIIHGIQNEKPKHKDVKNLEVIFEKIKEERLDTFGASDMFKRYLSVLKDLNNYEIKKIEGDNSFDPFISDCETKIQILLNQMSSGRDADIAKYHARERMIVEKETGCNIENMSAFDFYTHFSDIHERQKMMEMEEFTKNRRRAS